MAGAAEEQSPKERQGAERSFEVQLGSLGGFELRPTRLFVWKGEAREEDAERVVSFGRAPVGLEYPRRESRLRAGPVEVRTAGNPLMTIAIAGAIALRRWASTPEPPPER